MAMSKEDNRPPKNLSRRQFIASVPAGALGGASLWADIQKVLRDALSFASPISSSMMLPRICLSAINWIDEEPKGVRLRWMFPLQKPNISGDYLGFPESVTVKRAILPEVNQLPEPGTIINVGSQPTTHYPRQWWKRGLQLRSLAPTLFQPPDGYPSVQAITFRYKGPDSRCCVRDSNRCILGDFRIQNTQRLYFEGGDIAEVEFLADDAGKIKLEDDWFLDLYQSPQLDWTDVATIAVRKPLVDQTIGDFQSVISRMSGHPALKAVDWTAIKNHATLADKIKKVSDDDPKLSSPTWDVWLAIQSVLWEIAVLTGYGFIHGPQRAVAVQGDVVNLWLPQPSSQSTVYRIVVPHPIDPMLAMSNLVIVSPNKALPLKPPEDLVYQSPVVIPEQIVDDFDPSKPSTVRSVYLGAGILTWNHKQDPWAMGIDVTETVLTSPTVMKPQNPTDITERIQARTRNLGDLFGSSSRNFELAFPDCPLQSSAKTFDGWDRHSKPSPLQKVLFDLRHRPVPPGLACAVYDPSTQKVSVDRLVGKPKCLDSEIAYQDWAPDEIVRKQNGQVEIARRTRLPISLAVTIVGVSLISSNNLAIQLANAIPQGEFERGRLIANDQTGVIIEVSADRKGLKVSTDDIASDQLTGNDETHDQRCALFDHAPAAITTFVSGLAQIVEYPYADALWTKVYSTPQITPLDKQFNFSESKPLPQEGTDSLVYACRVVFNNFNGGVGYGPYSNAVSVLRKAPRPDVPPPFTVQLLGWDYYQRIVINVTLSADRENALFTIAWAPGRKSQWLEPHAHDPNPPNDPTLKAFASAGVTGQLGQQRTHRMRLLYEVLEVPEPHYSDLYITIGVKGVDKIGQESAYVLEELLILAT
jgi:hypothetical protein